MLVMGVVVTISGITSLLLIWWVLHSNLKLIDGEEDE